MFPKKNTREFYFIIQPDKEKYIFKQMHFHWRGSEHHLNGKMLGAELHLNFQSALDENKYIFLAFLFKVIIFFSLYLYKINFNVFFN